MYYNRDQLEEARIVFERRLVVHYVIKDPGTNPPTYLTENGEWNVHIRHAVKFQSEKNAARHLEQGGLDLEGFPKLVQVQKTTNTFLTTCRPKNANAWTFVRIDSYKFLSVASYPHQMSGDEKVWTNYTSTLDKARVWDTRTEAYQALASFYRELGHAIYPPKREFRLVPLRRTEKWKEV